MFGSQEDWEADAELLEPINFNDDPCDGWNDVDMDGPGGPYLIGGDSDLWGEQ